jgi:hypothetical protein
MVEECNRIDQAMCEEARQEECEQQGELLNGINWLGDSVSLLINTIVEDQWTNKEAEATQHNYTETLLQVIKSLTDK